MNNLRSTAGIYESLIWLMIILGLGFYFKNWLTNIKYIKTEMQRAGDLQEYADWRELWAIYWSVFPGMIPERAKAMGRFFHRGKHFKNNKNDGLMSTLALSLIGIAICGICLVGSTLAWFTASISTPATKIQLAKYTVTTIVKTGETEILPNQGRYTLEAGKIYTVTLTATGTATTGYCKVVIHDIDTFYTEQFPKYVENGEVKNRTEIVFNVIVENNASNCFMTIEPIWGSYSGNDNLITTEILIQADSMPDVGLKPTTSESKQTSSVVEETSSSTVEETSSTSETNTSTNNTESTSQTTSEIVSSATETSTTVSIEDNETSISAPVTESLGNNYYGYESGDEID